MEKKINNEELLSRREFFKKAAKGALPMIAAVALTNVPAIGNATTKSDPMGCTGTCYGACVGSCRGCENTCSGGCKNYGCRGIAKN